ncbi:hypothetical protein [uncultured Helicobacter sp.]|uniref:hypothetical protein n=1 Tax=uncultured Helicobacter sp. TaxID=175537 RepID=UPI0026060DFC|nr:hypothetical protein [uncultured Helicobacter sp.]
MAIAFQNNNPFGTFNNPFASNSFENLKPHIKQNGRESNAKESRKVNENTENQVAETTKNPLDVLRSSLTSKILGGLLNFGLQNAKNNAANLHNLRTLPNEMKPKEEQGKPLAFSNPLDTLKEVTKRDNTSKNTPELNELTFLNGDKAGTIGSVKPEDINIVRASSIEIQESITYTISYDSASGQYAQSLSYSSSLVANFDSEITDKNGNTFISRAQLVIGKSLESQITGGVESVNDTLKGFLEGQKFALEYDGELDEESFKNSGLDNMLLIMNSKNNAIADTFKEVLGQKNDFGKIYGRADEELVSLFENLHNQKAREKNSSLQTKEDKIAFLQNLINSSLEIFVGIPKENQNNPTLQDWLKSSNALTISTSYEQYSAQWIGKKLDNSESGLWWYGSYSSKSASFKFEA